MKTWVILFVGIALVSTSAAQDARNIAQYGLVRNWTGQAATILETKAYVAAGYDGLRILEISDPDSPYEMGRIHLPGIATDVAVSGGLAFVATGWGGLEVVDVTQPILPYELGFWDEQAGTAARVCTNGNIVCVAYAGNGLVLLDISDPAAPEFRSRLFEGENVTAIAMQNGILAVAGPSFSLRILDISDPTAPMQLSGTQTGGSYLAFMDEELFIADLNGGLYRYDITNPEQVSRSGNMSFGGAVNGLQVAPDHSYLIASHPSRFSVVSCPPGGDLREVRSCSIDNLKAAVPGNGALVALGGTGADLYDMANANRPVKVGFACNLGRDVLGIAKAGDYGCAIGRNLTILDLHYPDRPVTLASVPIPGSADPLDMTDQYVFLPCYSEGLRIFDLADPRNPQQVGVYNDQYLTIADVSVDGTRALIGGQNQIRVLDVSNPAAMELLGIYNSAGHAFFRSVLMKDGIAYCGVFAAGMWVIDFNDPSRPNRLSVCDLPGYTEDVAVEDGIAYISTWEAGEASGLYVVDVSDPTDPIRLGFCPLPEPIKSVAKFGNWVYVACNWAGIQVVDVTDPANPTKIGWWMEEGSESTGCTAFDRFVAVADRNQIGIFNNTFQVNSAPVDNPVTPSTLMLTAYPNPFNAEARLNFSLPASGLWRLGVYGVDGTEIARLENGWKPAGAFQTVFNAANLPAGNYFIRLSGNGVTEAKRMVLVK